MTASTKSNGGSNDLNRLVNRSKNAEAVGVLDSVDFVLEFESILAIRLHFLELVRAVAASKSINLSAYHWMIIQMSPIELFEEDIFDQLSQKYSIPISTVVNKQESFLVAIDESQILISQKRFCSTSLLKDLFEQEQTYSAYSNVKLLNHSATTPIMYSFSRLLQQANPRLWLAGTGFQYQDFVPECDSGSMLKKLIKDFTFVTLGSFMAIESFEAFIRFYVREDKLSNQEIYRLHRILKGRYRFAAAFVAEFCRTPQVDQAVRDLIEMSSIAIQRSLNALHRSYRSIYPSYFPEDGNTETIIGDYISTNDLLQGLLYSYFWTFETNSCCVDFHIKGAMYIQAGLGIIDIEDRNIRFDSYQNMILRVKVMEPLIALILNDLQIR